MALARDAGAPRALSHRTCAALDLLGILLPEDVATRVIADDAGGVELVQLGSILAGRPDAVAPHARHSRRAWLVARRAGVLADRARVGDYGPPECSAAPPSCLSGAAQRPKGESRFRG